MYNRKTWICSESSYLLFFVGTWHSPSCTTGRDLSHPISLPPSPPMCLTPDLVSLMLRKAVSWQMCCFPQSVCPLRQSVLVLVTQWNKSFCSCALRLHAHPCRAWAGWESVDMLLIFSVLNMLLHVWGLPRKCWKGQDERRMWGIWGFRVSKCLKKMELTLHNGVAEKF